MMAMGLASWVALASADAAASGAMAMGLASWVALASADAAASEVAMVPERLNEGACNSMCHSALGCQISVVDTVKPSTGPPAGELRHTETFTQ